MLLAFYLITEAAATASFRSSKFPSSKSPPDTWDDILFMKPTFRDGGLKSGDWKLQILSKPINYSPFLNLDYFENSYYTCEKSLKDIFQEFLSSINKQGSFFPDDIEPILEDDDEKVDLYTKIVLKQTKFGISALSKNFPIVITNKTESQTEYCFVVTTATDKSTTLRSIHPVTGNRKFGVKVVKNKIKFYVKAADRLSIISQPLDRLAFAMADTFVDGLRNKMKQIAKKMKCKEDVAGSYAESKRYDMKEVLENRCRDQYCSHPLCKEAGKCAVISSPKKLRKHREL